MAGRLSGEQRSRFSVCSQQPKAGLPNGVPVWPSSGQRNVAAGAGITESRLPSQNLLEQVNGPTQPCGPVAHSARPKAADSSCALSAPLVAEFVFPKRSGTAQQLDGRRSFTFVVFPGFCAARRSTQTKSGGEDAVLFSPACASGKRGSATTPARPGAAGCRGACRLRLREDLLCGLLDQGAVRKSGNTDFWRNNPVTQTRLPASGNKTFGSDHCLRPPQSRLYSPKEKPNYDGEIELLIHFRSRCMNQTQPEWQGSPTQRTTIVKGRPQTKRRPW